ncbi:hypothetical protein MD484_g2103, partial [Candolleomyces efflorescens]
MRTTRKKASSKKQLREDDDYTEYDHGHASDDHEAAPLKSQSKRRKTSSTSKSKSQDDGGEQASSAPKAKPVRRRNKLSLFPTMPLDILFEILGHLGPRDLLNLSRTNKEFCKMMLSSNTVTVWKAARQRFNAPEPPRDFTEPRWAALLFEHSCQSCGTKTVLGGIDWKIRMRLCSECKKSHLLCNRDAAWIMTFRGYDPSMFDYIPSTNKRPWTAQTADPNFRNRRLYWDEEVHAIAKEWNARRTAIQSSPEAWEDFEAWKKERGELLKSITSMIPVYMKWQKEYEGVKEGVKEENRCKRLEAVVSRFLELGYTSEDVRNAISVRTDGIYTGTPNVTTAAWNKLRPKLEPVVEMERKRRIARIMLPLISKRLKIFEDVYNNHLTKLKPSERYRCPPADYFRLDSEISRVLESDMTVDVTADDFLSMMDYVDGCIAKFQAEKKASALNSAISNAGVDVDTAEGALDLAIHVFRCDGARWTQHSLIGWPMMASHCCINGRVYTPTLPPEHWIPKFCSKLELNVPASQKAAELVVLAGLDPQTATIADMDEMDPRFVLDLSSVPNEWVDGYFVFSWSEAVCMILKLPIHLPSSSQIQFQILYSQGSLDLTAAGLPSSRYPSNLKFILASPEETKKARQHTLSVRESADAWSCNHCHDFFEEDKAGRLSVVRDHLKEKYDYQCPCTAKGS